MSLRNIVLFLAGLATATPVPDTFVRSQHPARGLDLFRRGGTPAATIIAQIMPKSVSCDGADYPDDCATNVQSADHFVSAMQKYGIWKAGQIAGVLALVAYESGELRYRHNVYPGRAGQGTSNMQLVDFNTKYAESIPELAANLTAANGDANAILALVTPDAYNFGSGPWFLSTQCTDAVRTQLAVGDDAGFAAYMGCVGVDATDSGRLAYWHTAQTAFGL